MEEKEKERERKRERRPENYAESLEHCQKPKTLWTCERILQQMSENSVRHSMQSSRIASSELSKDMYK